ncbi:MAG: CPBP family intramembrane metalloprotease [Acidimicrobiia bacterium]|nr:CPBP family intramembrane metalloprotease [Acidimicrobiia bacterium]
MQIAANLALIPIAVLADKEEAAQDVVQRLESARGLELAVIVLSAGLVAPLVEELLFRGLLLRALMRRVGPALAVGISALAFALVHLLDPGAIVVLPGLLLVGLVTGVLAVRSGDLSRPILLHVGFNLLVLVAALGGG